MALKAGDVLELQTQGGLAYVQGLFRHHSRSDFSYGWFIRVLQRVFPERPDKLLLAEIVGDPEQFCCFLADPKNLTAVGHYPPPPGANEFPIFKQFNGVTPSPEGNWVLWNGSEDRILFRLPKSALMFPHREIIDSVLLRKRIEQSWTHATDVPQACVSPDDVPFVFDRFPLFREFLSNSQSYGDVIGFLRAKGLIDTQDCVTGVTIDGPDFWQNDIARAWLEQLLKNSNWDMVLRELVEFRSHHICNADATARAYAAVGVVVIAVSKCRQLQEFQIPEDWGSAPLQAIREAKVVISQIGLRSGLHEAMRLSGHFAEFERLRIEHQRALIVH